jgi:EAL domain-containing protein (putative c-di-GMP-specific phosphodiesterase class I)
MDLEREITGAAARGELDLVYQPVQSLRDGRTVAVEALLRWRHPQLGTIMPAELLPIAASVGVAGDIGEWVVDAACRQLAAWSVLDPGLALSVNVAPRELLAPSFPSRVGAALLTHGINPERLVVEVAETWVAEDVPAVVAALAALRKLGVRAALDDFGAGQASLAHLRRLPVDMLKLDRSLVNVPADRSSLGGQAVLDVVVSLGRRLGLEIVAEGLETTEQVDRARNAGCPYGQGYALQPPSPAERVEAYLEEHRAASN